MNRVVASALLIASWWGIPHDALISDVQISGQVGYVPVQLPYALPPEAEFPDIPKATPAPKELSKEDLERAEAMLPLLEGRQELYAIGEFVHLGKPVVPVLVKALTMPGVRLRYNAIETLKIINDPAAIPHLLKVAVNTEEMTRVRAHALRTSVRLDAKQVLATLQMLVKDDSDTIRRTVAFESRYVKQKEVVPVVIDLLADRERYVSITALETLWVLTNYTGKPHNWEGSAPEERQQWAREIKDWWEARLKEIEGGKPQDAPTSWKWMDERLHRATARDRGLHGRSRSLM